MSTDVAPWRSSHNRILLTSPMCADSVSGMVLRVVACLCLALNCALPRCWAYCLTTAADERGCCAPRSQVPLRALPAASDERDDCCASESAVADSCCGIVYEADADGECSHDAGARDSGRSSSGQCTGCAVLCVCDAPKLLISPPAAPGRALLEAIHAALSLCTLDSTPAASPIAGVVAAVEPDWVAGESPPERLSRLSVWLN